MSGLQTLTGIIRVLGFLLIPYDQDEKRMTQLLYSIEKTLFKSHMQPATFDSYSLVSILIHLGHFNFRQANENIRNVTSLFYLGYTNCIHVCLWRCVHV